MVKYQQSAAAASDAESLLHSLGLAADSTLVTSVRRCVVQLASSTGVVASVQSLAQLLLSKCWPILLPTTQERVEALSGLLPFIADTGITVTVISYYLIIFTKAPGVSEITERESVWDDH